MRFAIAFSILCIACALAGSVAVMLTIGAPRYESAVE